MKCNFGLLIMCLLLLLSVGCKATEKSPQVLQQPPELVVTVGERTVNPSCSSPQWTVWDEQGNVIGGYISETGHALQLYQIGKTDLVTSEGEAKLRFGVEPDQIIATCWEENQITQDFPVSEKCILEDHMLKLYKGSYIYQIEAKWNQPLYEGTAYYSFYITVE